LLLLFLAASVAAQGPINPSILAPQKLTAEQEALRRTAVDRAVTQARDAVVHVMVWVAQHPPFKKERPSSGVLVDPTGLVITHWDLVADAFGADGKLVDKHTLKVKLRNGDLFPATMVAKHQGTGLALLKIEAEGKVFYSVDLADAAKAVPGEPVATLSFGDGKENRVFGGALVRACGGTVVGATKPAALSARQILLTDATITRESHGAAMLDASGRLLGIVNASHVGRDLQEPTLIPVGVPETQGHCRERRSSCARCRQRDPEGPKEHRRRLGRGRPAAAHRRHGPLRQRAAQGPGLRRDHRQHRPGADQRPPGEERRGHCDPGQR
jgi:S1-C subfamily serine protease